MTIDQRAREAGVELRRWDPELPEEVPHELVGVAVHRRRTARLAAAAAGLVVVAGVGLVLADDAGRRPVETAPAAEEDPEDHDVDIDPVPTTPLPPTTVAPAPPPSVTTATPPPPPGPSTCRIALSGGGDAVVRLPPGWHANEALPSDGYVAGVQACTRLAPWPVELYDPQELNGWASNAVVTLHASPLAGPGPSGSWEDHLALQESWVAPPEAEIVRLSSERRMVAGVPALREEFVERGQRWVRWQAMVGDTVVTASAGEHDDIGYGDAVAALDEMMESLRHEG